MISKNKTNDLCLEYLRPKWRAILSSRFEYFLNKSPESSKRMELIMDSMIQTLETLFLRFSKLKDSQFNAQIMLDDAGAYSQRLAELLFYYRLLGMGFENFDSRDAGPDFIAEKNNEKFCFEVVTPTPNANIRELIGRDELTPEERDTVFRERLLSVTSVLKTKLAQFEDHKASGHVPEGSHYIIVVNDSLLLPYCKPWYGAMAELCFGDSTLPIVVDATLGSGDIDFSAVTGQSIENAETREYQTLIMKSNFGISINGGEALTPEDSSLQVEIRQKIPTRKNTNHIFVDIAESAGVAGFYQITLREDLLFYHVFPPYARIMPPAALITPIRNKHLLREAIQFTSAFTKDENLVQPNMSPARLFGIEPAAFNNEAIFNMFFKPVLSGEESHKSSVD